MILPSMVLSIKNPEFRPDQLFGAATLRPPFGLPGGLVRLAAGAARPPYLP